MTANNASASYTDHLGIQSTDAKCAIITGDPHRVSIISSMFDTPHKISDKRGFMCYMAYHNGVPILVVGVGIGAPSTAIAVEELIELGIGLIVRIGTCGALQANIAAGDLVIPTGCVREDGTTVQYVERAFPAVPDHIVIERLTSAANTRGIPVHVGITHCKDAYYLEYAGKQLDPDKTGSQWERWRRAGVLVTEMETSALFVLASLRRIRAGAIFVNIGKATPPDAFNRSLENAVLIAGDVISTLACNESVANMPGEISASMSYLHGTSRTWSANNQHG